VTTNLKLASFTSGGGTVDRTLEARWAETVNVKDYGAVGDGATNDGPAIQAAFDAAFGTAGAPHGTGASANREVYFPSGTYLTSQQLFLNNVRGGHIYGNGPHQTIIEYTGTDTGTPDGVTAMVTGYSLCYTRIEGIQFDAGTADAAFRLDTFARSGTSISDGTGDSYTNCIFKGGVIGAFFAGFHAGGTPNSALASEQRFVNCGFVDATCGLRIQGSNALDYTMVGCYFENNDIGVSSRPGGAIWLLGCRYRNNSIVDVHQAERNAIMISGGYSTSLNFATVAVGLINSVYHANASEGGFWIREDDGEPHIDTAYFTIDGCRSTNGILFCTPTAYAWLRGNDFQNAGYLDDFVSDPEQDI
jgi:hypothetical protein